MAFTVEDGSVVTDANSYVDEAYVTGYLTDRNRQTENSWDSISTAQKQAAMVEATDYVENRFSSKFVGVRVGSAQELSWPRSGAYNSYGYLEASDGIPKALKKAVAEYAIRAVSATLLPDPVVDASAGSVESIKEKIGPLETDVKYVAGSYGQVIIKPFPAADKLLNCLLHSTGGSVVR